MITYATRLEAKVAARNQVNALALEMAPKMIEALRPFVGQKILNQGDVLSAKVKAALPSGEYTPERHFWYTANKYALWANFKTCTSSPGHYGDHHVASYAETSFLIGEMDGHTLKAVKNGQTARTDFTVEEIQKAREAFKAAQAALDSAQSALSGFGEYDN